MPEGQLSFSGVTKSPLSEMALELPLLLIQGGHRAAVEPSVEPAVLVCLSSVRSPLGPQAKDSQRMSENALAAGGIELRI